MQIIKLAKLCYFCQYKRVITHFCFCFQRWLVIKMKETNMPGFNYSERFEIDDLRQIEVQSFSIHYLFLSFDILTIWTSFSQVIIYQLNILMKKMHQLLMILNRNVKNKVNCHPAKNLNCIWLWGTWLDHHRRINVVSHITRSSLIYRRTSCCYTYLFHVLYVVS